MPKAGKKDGIGNKRGRPRLAANGYKLPDHLPAGEVLVDLTKHQWKLGKSIGLGGFGEIYLASSDVRNTVGPDAQNVIKVEPHSNGPLFVEIHCLIQVGKSELIEQWMKRKRLNYLGMPRFIGSGSHEYKGIKYRFFVMERFGEDLQKILERNKKVFPAKTVYTLGIKIIDILEYIHSFGYIHADVKASNLLLGYGKGKENQIYLVDFGLACKYIQDGKHREYKEDLRKAHDGTIEFTSRDAHIGAHSRRGDLEILGYNMLQWLCGTLPWEGNLKSPENVNQKKQDFMSSIPGSVRKCFNSNSYSEGIGNYLKYVANLTFDAEPDYEHCRTILKQAITDAGYRNDGKLIFSSEISPHRTATLKKPAKLKDFSTNSRKKILSSNQVELNQPKNLHNLQTDSVSSVVQSYRGSDICKNNDSSLDNPTPAMLLIMQKRMESLASDEAPTTNNQITKGKKRASPESASSSSCRSSKGRGPKHLRKDSSSASDKISLCKNKKSFSPEF